MQIIPLYPYDDYKGWKIFHRGMGRWMLSMKHKVDGHRKTISYARYLMSVHEGRILNRSEHVDHIDEDKANDVIENLQILSNGDNTRKHIEATGKRRMVDLICPSCEVEFQRKWHEVNDKILRGGKPACSRRCGVLYGHQLQGHKMT